MSNHVSSEDRNRLQLIRASAGSGKTHHLTGAYIRLLFDAPEAYRHILAVTFTNKATEEMKSRILQELNLLSSGEKSGYLEQLMAQKKDSEQKVRSQAKNILQAILHDYSSFSISTIDGFFQRAMRAFTREMGLTGGYAIELNQDTILLEITDLMLSELDKRENKQLSLWLLDFMQNQAENGKTWNIKDSILKLSQELFNETYKTLSEEEKSIIQDKNQLLEYRKEMHKMVRTFENTLKELSGKSLSLMEKHDVICDDFKYGAKSGVSILKRLYQKKIDIPSDRFYGLQNNLDVWFAKKNPKEPNLRTLYQEGLNDLFCSICSYFDANYRNYRSAQAVLKHFFTLGILSDIQRRLNEYQKENNSLFLSDTTDLLRQIIQDDATPFVYEKIGTRIHHYMIDEFQDTSAMQWSNFRPLLRESVDNNDFNLIVGDVKQSIYRWRNTDWRLLEQQVVVDFTPENVEQMALDTNWRSDQNIIRFNNSFFRLAVELLQQQYNLQLAPDPEDINTENFDRKIVDAYRHVYQQIPAHKQQGKGCVSFYFLQKDKNAEDSIETQILNQLPHEIEKLQDKGFQLKDIAILVRKNEEANQVAEKLLQYAAEHPNSPYRYNIVSNEALLISNAQSVKTIIALLRYFQNRKDATCKMIAVYELNRLLDKSELHAPIDSHSTEFYRDFPSEYRDTIESLDCKPFYEMAEGFFDLVSEAIDESESAYVQAFMDSVLRFSSQSASDLYRFIEWWDTEGKKKKLFLPDNQDAIRILTIHKSKGLDFGVVILPFLDWTFDHSTNHDNILWCKPTVHPFNKIPIVPINYSSKLEHSIFALDYMQENLYACMDNINLLYVALTRAKHEIIGFGIQPAQKENNKKNASSKHEITNVSDLLWCAFTDRSGKPTANYPEEEHISLSEYLKEEESFSVFQFGEERETLHDKPFHTESETPFGKWSSIPYAHRLQLRLNGIGFFADDGSRDRGTLMHEIMRQIHRFEDIDKAVNQKVTEGLLPESERESLSQQLRELLSLETVKEWYNGDYEVLNETQVLHPSFGFARPDRVMLSKDRVIIVDYKFGKTEDPKYVKQVQFYKRYIQEMGYSNVSGYIFYASHQRIIKV